MEGCGSAAKTFMQTAKGENASRRGATPKEFKSTVTFLRLLIRGFALKLLPLSSQR